MSRRVAVIIIAVSILICVIAGLACKPKTRHDTDMARYRCWQDSVTKTIEKEFVPALPARKDVDMYGDEYNYIFSQGTLSDPNFVIYVSMRFPDKASYEKEIEKYNAFLTNPIQQHGTCHYAIQYSLEKESAYTDKEIRDGMYYNFQIISANEQEYVIQFLVAHVWDYYQNDFLINYLHSIHTGEKGTVCVNPFEK